MAYKKIHRKDKVYYEKNRTLVLSGATPVSTDTDIKPPTPIVNYRDLTAGEDLSSWIDQPIMIGTDGLAYKAEAHLDNWNRVIGILSIANTTSNPVRVQTSGLYQSSSYDWSGSNVGDVLVVRSSGISSSILAAAVGSEVMHIHIANVIDDNTIEIIPQPQYKFFL